ncbi:DUF3951 domain-containing protein [Metabacillus iocasae]|uniref:DUF3951 domain-containing protein n=1 Tax=Priestia iocasae TaxID=2291674 RepID=A0ABS2R0Q7_9BACI|nr:DUF3951 domain-containing protein [Metabacillus iocasae]MBM7705033.1 hypothetical protein [Metabacillus iocasae]
MIVLYTAILFPLLVVCLIFITSYKLFVKKAVPNNYYTPLDYITGQTSEECHKEKE